VTTDAAVVPGVAPTGAGGGIGSRPDEPLALLCVGKTPEPFQDVERFTDRDLHTIERVADAPAALRALAKGGWSLVLVALEEDPEEQLEWWVDVLRRVPRRPRLAVLTPAPSLGFILRASALGVLDILPLPVPRDAFAALINRVRESREEVTLPLPDLSKVTVGPTMMVSGSHAMLPVFRSVAQVAPSSASVLIEGDSGTGKELVARAVHLQGPRASRPFVAINCAAIPENLLESELFGHEKGAFSGAIARKIGRFERAGGGTLFLDEIGDMSLVLQSKILRAVQEREIERVGGSEPIVVDVRVIAATHRDLRELIAEGRFREDLYFRLAVVTMHLPRLVDRDDDIRLLAASFLTEFGPRYGKHFTGITDQALALLCSRAWPGNVRELRNVIERAVLVAEGDVLRGEHLPEAWRTDPIPPRGEENAPLGSLREMEARHIKRALDHTHGHVSDAARILGVHRNTLARKIREYGL
jgi:two-component system response regulator HydG